MTPGEIFNKRGAKPKILVAPLEWGLGHATRCIPIIKEFISLECEVFLAAEGATKNLLTAEFPNHIFIPLIGYRMKYSRKKNLLALKLFTQIPKILYTIFNEHKWLKKIVKEYDIDAVISDNRFGLFHKKIPCVYITHQLQVKTGGKITDMITRKIHAWFIKKYSTCWIPDYETRPGIGGELSHVAEMPANARYIGCLSRFERSHHQTTRYDLVFSISGPEPQRSLFEKLLVNEAKQFEGSILLLRGLPGTDVAGIEQLPNMEVHNHLQANQLSDILQSAGIIISRSGYTSIMDYLKLGCKAILVPTPGQKEQEYLAEILSAQKLFVVSPQENFSLKKVLAEAKELQQTYPAYDMDQYKKAVGEFVSTLR